MYVKRTRRPRPPRARPAPGPRLHRHTLRSTLCNCRRPPAANAHAPCPAAPRAQALTYVAYMHVAFQPLVVNNYFWGGFKTTRPDLVKFIMVGGRVARACDRAVCPGAPVCVCA